MDNIFFTVLVILIGVDGLYHVFLLWKREKAHEKRFKELLEKEKLLNDLQSQICTVSDKKPAAGNKDLQSLPDD